MPYKDPEYMKKWRQKNKLKISNYNKNYSILNNETIKIKKSIWDNTDKGRKTKRISIWRSRGLISEDYDKIYERYILTEECDNCGILLDEDFNTKKCMDHSHTTGEFRNILCSLCNVNRID